ncbi:MAG TPA: hypothetical protein VIJ88_00950 [Candidatus Paceibacterota bacterium]
METTHNPKPEKTPFIDLFLRSIAVLGLIAVLVLGAWGIIQLAVAIPSFFGNIGSGTSSLLTNSNASKETLTVSSIATINSGQTLQLSWTHSNTDSSAQYSYAISYTCQNGLSLGVPVPTGAYQGAPCNTPFNYVNATQHMTVIPVLGTSSPATTVVFTVTATKLSTGAITAQGSATTTVNPSVVTPTKPVAAAPKPAAPAAAAPSTAYYPAATRAALYGYPDLAVHIVSVVPNGTRTTVQFVIENDGTNSVRSGWTFNATLPIDGGYTFESQPQQMLYPGDKIVYNLGFDNTFGSAQNGSYNTGPSYYNAGGYTCNGYNCTTPSQYNTGYNATPYSIGTITITADPQSYIAELNKGNNAASASTPVY